MLKHALLYRVGNHPLRRVLNTQIGANLCTRSVSVIAPSAHRRCQTLFSSAASSPAGQQRSAVLVPSRAIATNMATVEPITSENITYLYVCISRGGFNYQRLCSSPLLHQPPSGVSSRLCKLMKSSWAPWGLVLISSWSWRALVSQVPLPQACAARSHTRIAQPSPPTHSLNTTPLHRVSSSQFC